MTQVQSRPSLDQIFGAQAQPQAPAVSAASKRPSLDEIFGAQAAPLPKTDASFTERVGEDIAKRKAQEKKDVFSEDQSPVSAGLQGVGQYMALGSDITGEAAKSAINAVPESIKQPIADTAKKTANYVANTDIGKAGIAKAVEAKQAWESFSKEHPEAARNIGAVGNIAGAFPAGLEASAAEKGALSAGEAAAPALKSAGENLTKAGEKQAAERKAKSFTDLVSPKETKKVKEDNVGKTVEKGFLRKKEVVPDKFTADVANTVSQVPGINPSRSYQHNYNQIAAENKAEAIKLNEALKTSNATIPLEKINKAAANIRNSLAKQTFLVGDAKKVSDKMLEEAGSLIKKNGNTAAGLLKTRQEFDSWAKGQMGGDPFSDSNKARGASLKAVRDSLNNLISDAVPDAKVKESLKKQFHLYSALDNIQDKAAAEGKNVLTRSLAKLEDAIPSNNALLRHGAGLAAAVPYAAYKGATSPTLKKAVGKSLSGIGDILSSSKKEIPLPETKVFPASPKLLPYYPYPKTYGSGKRTAETAALMDKIKELGGKSPQEPIRAAGPAAPRVLPAPEKINIVDRQGNVRNMTAAERQFAEEARKKAINTGLTPDVRAAQIRNEVNKAYEQRNLQRNAVKEAQIAKIAEQSAVPISQLIEMSDKNIKDLVDSLGEKHPDTAFAQALRKAIKEKK